VDRIYFDHNATTPLDSQAYEQMKPFLQGEFGNPSSVHRLGQEARRAVDRARRQAPLSRSPARGQLVGAGLGELILTSGGTEANNLALFGLMAQYQFQGQVLTTTIEHPSVANCCAELERLGCEITLLPVSARAAVDLEGVRAAITDRTRLISVMLANNDTGALQPVAEIGALARSRGILLHTDAVQGVGRIEVAVNRLNVDMLSISAHKLYGPKGVGALYLRQGVKLRPLLFGGDQELKRRAGTENVAGVIGFGEACRLANQTLDTERERIDGLRRLLWRKLTELDTGILLNGDLDQSLPNTLNISCAGIEGASLVMNLDLQGVAASVGSACSSGSAKPSPVIHAMGYDDARALSSIRLSLGRASTEAEVLRFAGLLGQTLARMRRTASRSAVRAREG
jgi:cysteine desulfurase